MAEAHPVGFRWVMKAKERGATIIHVDPRFSRTSALADIWVPLRVGTDIVLLGAVDLNNTLQQMLDQLAERVTAYIVAPEEQPDRFDSHGCLIPSA